MLTMEIKDQGVLVAYTGVSFPGEGDKDGVRQQTSLFTQRTPSGFDPLAVLRDIHTNIGRAILDIEAKRREQAMNESSSPGLVLDGPAQVTPTLKFAEPVADK